MVEVPSNEYLLNEYQMPQNILDQHYKNWMIEDIICYFRRYNGSIPIAEVEGLCGLKGELGNHYHQLLLAMTEVKGDRRYLKEVLPERHEMH